MIHDVLGEREEATKSYRMALAVQTDGIAKDTARQYLSEPYRKDTALFFDRLREVRCAFAGDRKAIEELYAACLRFSKA